MDARSIFMNAEQLVYSHEGRAMRQMCAFEDSARSERITGNPKPRGKPATHRALPDGTRLVPIGQQGAEQRGFKGCTSEDVPYV